MSKVVNVPITKDEARSLVAGEKLLLTGTIYTARDAAHKRKIGRASCRERVYDLV